MQIVESENMIKLVADEGKRITNKDRSIFVEKIYLPPMGSINEYEEVGRDIWKYFIEEENPDIKELQFQVKDINDNLSVIMNSTSMLNDQNNSTIDSILEAIGELYSMVSMLMEEKGGE